MIGCTDLGDPLLPECQLSSSSLNFGEVLPGDSLEATLMVTNSGPIPTDGKVTVSGDGMSIVSGGGNYVLEPEQSVSIVVRFAPADTGSYNGMVMTGSDCGDVPLSGEAVEVLAGTICEIVPDSLDFGDVTVGSNTQLAFKITNSGLFDFSGTVTAPCGDFTIVLGGGPYTLEPGDSLNVTVRFAPAATGPSSCLITTGVACLNPVAFGDGVAVVPTVSFGADIQPIFNLSCATARCHARTPAASLDLRAAASYAALFGVTSRNYPPAVRVVAGVPAASVLYGKVANTGQFGGKMPPFGTLTAQQIELIRVWILEGALDN